VDEPSASDPDVASIVQVPSSPEPSPDEVDVAGDVDGESEVRATGGGASPPKTCQRASPAPAATSTTTVATPATQRVLRVISRPPPRRRGGRRATIGAAGGYAFLGAGWEIPGR